MTTNTLAMVFLPSPFISRLFRRKKIHSKSQLQIPELKRVEKLIQKGNLERALREAEIIEEKGELGENSLLQNQVLKSSILTQQGASDRGLRLAEEVFKKSQQLGAPLIMVDALISRATALLELGRLSECLQVIADAENQLSTMHAEKLQYAVRDSSLKHLRGKAYRKKGDLDLAHEALQQCLATRQELGDSHVIADALNVIGIIYASKGAFDSAIEHLEQAMAIFEKLKNKLPIIKIRNNIGMICWQTGKLDLAIEYFRESYALSEELGNRRYVAAISLNIGLILWHRGELDSALEHYHKGLELYKELANKTEMTTCLNNIGIIHRMKGELVLALKFFQESLALAEEQGNKPEIAAALNNIGNLYRSKGDKEASFSYFERSLHLLEEIGNDFDTCEPLYNLIDLAVHEGSPEDAQPYFHRLKEMNDKGEIVLISQIYRIARAMMLKTSERIIKKGEAQLLFQQVVEEEISKHDVTVAAIENLCELLIHELGVSGNEEILIEVESLLRQLLDIATNQHNFELLANTYLLQSKIALLELNIRQARKLLTQAQLIAEEKSLWKLARAISGEFDTFLNQQASWENYIDRNASMRERIELARLEELVTRMIRQRMEDIPELPPEEPVMVFILANSGLSLFSKAFIPKDMTEDQLIGGFLTAIRSMGSEIFSKSGIMERIMFQEYTISLKALQSKIFCYVFKGQSYSALRKLDQFMERIQASSSINEGLARLLRTGMVLTESKITEIETIANKIFLSSAIAV
ncbi:MAG: tetratricopeptide repeat protein [Candidatus Heimdallarchaeota archaeon]